MTGAVLSFRGPVSRVLLRRFGGGWLRRLRHVSTGTVAAGAVYVAAATEPNLSGAWLMTGSDGDLTPIVIHHVGLRVVAEGPGGEGFDAEWVADREFRGLKALFVHEDLKGKCTSRGDSDAKIVASDDFNRITVYWTGRSLSQNCQVVDTFESKTNYRRLTD